MIRVTAGLLKQGASECKLFQADIDKLNFNLSKEKLFDVSLDQSNSCTGVTIRPVDESFVIMMEVLNINVPFEYYRLQLKDFLLRNLKGVKLRYLIMEEPLGYMSSRGSNKQLTVLKKVLKTMEPDLDVQVFTTINVTSWRHGLMPKEVIDDRGNKLDRRTKDAVVYTVLNHYPQLSQFADFANSDYDGFESLGILLGYLQRHNIGKGLLKNVGKVKTRKKGMGCFKYIDLSNLPSEEVIRNATFQLNSISLDETGKPATMLSYNDEFNIYGNVKMALANKVSLMFVTHELDSLSVLLRMGIRPKPNHILLMGVVDLRILDKDVKSTGGEMIKDLISHGFTLFAYQ